MQKYIRWVHYQLIYSVFQNPAPIDLINVNKQDRETVLVPVDHDGLGSLPAQVCQGSNPPLKVGNLSSTNNICLCYHHYRSHRKNHGYE